MIPVSTVVAGALVFLFLLLASLHIYWALGGRWGAKATIPEVDGIPAFRPSRTATLGVAVLLATAAMVVALRSNMLPGQGAAPWLLQLGVWTLCAVFTLRAVGNFSTVGFFKVARNTAFARLDTPCTLRSALSSPWAASLSHSNHEPHRPTCCAVSEVESSQVVTVSACFVQPSARCVRISQHYTTTGDLSAVAIA